MLLTKLTVIVVTKLYYKSILNIKVTLNQNFLSFKTIAVCEKKNVFSYAVVTIIKNKHSK